MPAAQGGRATENSVWAEGVSEANLQQPFDAAVVIATVLRPELAQAVGSVYRQRSVGRIHIVIGVDVVRGDRAVLEEIERDRPDNCAVTVLDLGYSTAQRHGGLYPATDGGALRTILSLIANSRYVAYLDDDNWFEEDHLASLLATIGDHGFAYSLRVLVDRPTMKQICVDRWHSVGPGRGAFEAVGGFCDPNTLLVDKMRCHYVLPRWSLPVQKDKEKHPTVVKEDTADRNFFLTLAKHFEGAATGRATVHYSLLRKHVLWRDIVREAKDLGLTPDALREFGIG